MKKFIKKFDELTNKELYLILQLRNEVFVVEQNCVYQDADGKDDKAIHLFYKNGEEITAYTRLFSAGEYFDNASIGRVVVSPKYRRQNLGKKIMIDSINYLHNELKEPVIEISAQSYLKRFYNELGFKEKGKEYMEDGIPHIRMILNKKKK
jgi:ElaA protein